MLSKQTPAIVTASKSHQTLQIAVQQEKKKKKTPRREGLQG
jgi:hypothetical protein